MDLGLSENAMVQVVIREGRLILDPKPHESLADLVARITDDNRHEEVDWGQPRGKEVW